MNHAEIAAQAAVAAARHPSHGGLVEWHSISVVRFADGVARAFHNHLDMSTRKLVAESLSEPLGYTDGYPWHVINLLAAAEELEARHTDDHGV